MYEHTKNRKPPSFTFQHSKQKLQLQSHITINATTPYLPSPSTPHWLLLHYPTLYRKHYSHSTSTRKLVFYAVQSPHGSLHNLSFSPSSLTQRTSNLKLPTCILHTKSTSHSSSPQRHDLHQHRNSRFPLKSQKRSTSRLPSLSISVPTTPSHKPFQPTTATTAPRLPLPPNLPHRPLQSHHPPRPLLPLPLRPHPREQSTLRDRPAIRRDDHAERAEVL